MKEGKSRENGRCVSPGSLDGLYIGQMLAYAQTGQISSAGMLEIFSEQIRSSRVDSDADATAVL